ncbi:hypothetical protein ACFQL4_24780 [Halosimplex aquaticum]
MTDYDVGDIYTDEYSNKREYAPARDVSEEQEEYRLALMEDNGGSDASIRDINSAGQDFIFRTGYWIDDKHPSKVNDRSNLGNNYAMDVEFRINPRDHSETSLKDPRPKTTDSGDGDMTVTSLTATAGVGVGPFTAGISVSHPLSSSAEREVDRRDHDEYGDEWTIDSWDTWPTSPSSPDSSSDIDELPTVECQVAPDANGSDYRWIESESRFTWKYYTMSGEIIYRDTGWTGTSQYYIRTGPDGS